MRYMEMIYIDDEGNARKTNVSAAFETDTETNKAFESVRSSQCDGGRFLLDLCEEDGEIVDTLEIDAGTFAAVTNEPVLSDGEYVAIDEAYWHQAQNEYALAKQARPVMKTSLSTAQKLVISDLLDSYLRLDPVTVFFEDYEPGKGKITIECYGKSWSSYWGGMSGLDVATFFCACDNHYLAKNLSSIPSSILALDKLPEIAAKEIIKSRRAKDISAETARELYDAAGEIHAECVHDLDHEFMVSVFGDDWWHALPESENPDYAYLCRIISAVKLGIKQSGLVESRRAG